MAQGTTDAALLGSPGDSSPSSGTFMEMEMKRGKEEPWERWQDKV